MAADNLKTRVTADTSDFKKGMREAKNALRDFEKQGSSALSGISGSLDGLGGELGDIGRNIQNATNLFKSMGEAGGRSVSGIDRALVGLKGAIAGLGLSAAINAFKELNRSADIFRATIEGTNLELQTKTYVDTFRASMEEQLGEGKAFSGFLRGVKETGAKVLSTAGALVVTTAKSAVESMVSMEGPAAGLERLATDWQAVYDASVKADTAGRAAKQYQGELNRALDERLNKTNEWKELQYQITANERIAADTSYTNAEREKAVNEAKRLQAQLSSEQVANAQDILRWMTLISAEARDSKADTEALVQAQGMVSDLKRDEEQRMRSLDKLQNRITNSSGGQTASAKETQQATELTLEAAMKLVEVEKERARITEHNNQMMEQARKELANSRFNETWGATIAALPGVSGMPGNTAQKMSPDSGLMPSSIQKSKESFMDLTDTVLDGALSMSEALGDLVGNLINGENAWQGFAQAGISVVADMLSTVGKAFITEGIGVEAAKLALKSGNGIAAIAAGSAMVALAAAMKTTMSNAAANWSGGGGAAVASSSYSSGSLSAGSVAQTVNVRVTGTLTGEGSKLKAVLNNEDTRLATTT